MAHEKNEQSKSLYVKLPENEYCIDYIIVSNEKVILAKKTDDASKVTPGLAGTLKTIADFLDALPIVLTDKFSGEKLEESIIYSRHNIPVVNRETFEEIVLGASFPLIYFTHGGVYVKVKGAKLKELREKMGLSRGELAWRVGVSNKAIANYEEGESDVSLDVALKLEEIFGDVIFEEATPESLKLVFNEKIKAREIEPRDPIIRSIFNELRSYGFKNYVFTRVPFDAGVKLTREKMKVKIAIKKEASSGEVNIASRVSQQTHTPLIVISDKKEEIGDTDENLIFVRSQDPRSVKEIILRLLKKEGRKTQND